MLFLALGIGYRKWEVYETLSCLSILVSIWVGMDNVHPLKA